VLKVTYSEKKFLFLFSSSKACTVPELTIGKEFLNRKLFKGVFAANIYYVVLLELQQQESLTRKDVILFNSMPRKKIK